ncbi:hypothetical protein AB685_17225 [Bacillus sp. LL01]|nr:hypothetical protein AB685_17225 [Bacillus sp. LL01]
MRGGVFWRIKIHYLVFFLQPAKPQSTKKRRAADDGKKGGEFYTPSKVVELIVKLIKPEEGVKGDTIREPKL